MLSLTEKGEETARALWDKPNASEEERAFVTAADFVSYYIVLDAYALANMLPFIRGEKKLAAVREWIDRGLIEKGRGFRS